MIVKNETPVIKRCLGSVLPIIDYWVIVDTGSTDGTQEMIRAFMAEKKIPGELHERPWKNFAHNRNEALSLAKGKGDFVLFIDADEYLSFEPDFKLPSLKDDFYYMTTVMGGTRYMRMGLLSLHKESKWVGVVHEYVEVPPGSAGGTLEKVVLIPTPEGNRSTDPNKYLKDAALFEAALLEDPDNTRSVFYLAQSYRDAGKGELALANYKKRAEMGGWDQEVFWSLWQVALLQEQLNMPSKDVIDGYLKAFQYRNTRVEPLCQLIQYLRKEEKYALGYSIGKLGISLPIPDDILFVQEWMYTYGLPLEYSICAYWVGDYQEAYDISKKILAIDNLPENVRDCVTRNLGFARGKLIEQMILKELKEPAELVDERVVSP